jgi:tetratricopeptide (TPR) repeat protein
MSDPLRTDAPSASDAGDRDAKIEQLLLVGLDHYFAAKYEQAITVWTRALFIDRSHARARAYIERARSAIAERQRESEELLQNGLAAFTRGEGDEARRLLQAAMNQGAPSDEALAVLDRLSRLEPAVAPKSAAASRPGPAPPLPTEQERVPSNRAGLIVALAFVVLAGVAGVLVSGTDPANWQSLVGLEPPPAPLPTLAASGDGRLPIPLRGETALARARALAATGHYHDALAALDNVRPTDLQKPDADQLKADIQRQLVALVSSSAASPDLKGGGPLP